MRLLPAILLLLPLSVPAQTQVPNVFEDGTPASAAEVNENFEWLGSRTEALAQAGDKLFFANGYSWIATGYRRNESDGTISFELGKGKALLDGKNFDLQITAKYYPHLMSTDDHILCPAGDHYPREITMIFSTLAGYIVFQSKSANDSMISENEYASLVCMADLSQTTYVEVVASAGIFRCSSGFLKSQTASYAQTDLPTWTGQPATLTSVPVVQGIDDRASSGVTTDNESFLEIPAECP